LATAPTLTDAWTRFERDHLGLKKESTRRSYKAVWKDKLQPAFGKRRIKDITRGDVDSFHKKLSATPYQANRILALLSRLMNLAEAWEWRIQGTNPCRHIVKFAENARQRFLAPGEIAAIDTAAVQLLADQEITPHAVNILHMLLLTGARSGELASAEWGWVDWDRMIIALPTSKTGAKIQIAKVHLSRALARKAHPQPAQALGAHLRQGRAERGAGA